MYWFVRRAINLMVSPKGEVEPAAEGHGVGARNALRRILIAEFQEAEPTGETGAGGEQKYKGMSGEDAEARAEEVLDGISKDHNDQKFRNMLLSGLKGLESHVSSDVLMEHSKGWTIISESPSGADYKHTAAAMSRDSIVAAEETISSLLGMGSVFIEFEGKSAVMTREDLETGESFSEALDRRVRETAEGTDSNLDGLGVWKKGRNKQIRF